MISLPSHKSATLTCGRFVLPLSKPLVMGIVNVTPDSFQAEGRYNDPTAAIAHARRLIEEGADILDVGAESTRPGSASITVAEELERLLPLGTQR
jgi:dihydropteroate synthase